MSFAMFATAAKSRLPEGANWNSHPKAMKRTNISFVLISLVLTATANGANSDGNLEKLEGSWIANFHSASIFPRTKASFPNNFLTGNVGAMWKFEHDGTLTVFLPCDINERFRKGNVAIGAWELDAENNLHLRARMLTESQTSIEIDGQIEFDSYPSKEFGAGTMTIHSSNRMYYFGRYEENDWTCIKPPSD